jgi:hypothetical protein
MLSDMTFRNETTAEPEPAGIPAPVRKLASVSLDCTDPSALAEFYGNLLGMRQAFATADGSIVALSDGAVAVTMMRAENHVAPTWPEPGQLQRMHLDSVGLGTDGPSRQRAARPSYRPMRPTGVIDVGTVQPTPRSTHSVLRGAVNFLPAVQVSSAPGSTTSRVCADPTTVAAVVVKKTVMVYSAVSLRGLVTLPPAVHPPLVALQVLMLTFRRRVGRLGGEVGREIAPFTPDGKPGAGSADLTGLPDRADGAGSEVDEPVHPATARTMASDAAGTTRAADVLLGTCISELLSLLGPDRSASVRPAMSSAGSVDVLR